MNLEELVRNAGVVGAGGAGFPAHVKARARVEFILANGAECEPLLHKDYEVMVNNARAVVDGVRLLINATGAREGIIGIKEKNARAIEAVRDAIDGDDVRLHLLGDFYPSGDEYILVYEATGRLIPPQGLPLDVGIVVNNVETLVNISAAAASSPVTRKFITVAGAVNRPTTMVVPIGTSFRDVIAAAGGASVADFAVFVSGIMMGKLEFDLDLPITKTCAGLVVLPVAHTLVRRKGQPEQTMHRIGKSACDQCSYCTELCPRFTLGYDVQPHKVMRSLSFTATGENVWNQYASLCCGCGICTLYACPEELFPKEACDKAKRDLKAADIHWTGPKEVTPHPMYEYRRTPLKQLVAKLGIEEYDVHTPFDATGPSPERVAIPLAQHIGAPSVAVVRAGESVRAGQLIGEIPDGQLGARVHASIDGRIESVGENVVIARA
ncbi:MAG: 4Fe-4S dicluster domain-containing protein [Blastocatellia bacterium]|jgi:Na+-translocating ferredoxin:NAD+ oxidoreductase RnfC subunit|nr:4Fe-4S dicluster domain-containing protein [Blastocatellia bacterium]MBK6425908.1 4Fe-4S dicluster domain-containing protein [Blastocatellia bacterium]